jgi:hypothetical protein
VNRLFSTVALQSALAAAVVTVAPLAQAAAFHNPDAGIDQSAQFVSTANRAEVRQAAIAARDSELRSGLNPNAGIDQSERFVSTANRVDVRQAGIAERDAALRSGVNPDAGTQTVAARRAS